MDRSAVRVGVALAVAVWAFAGGSPSAQEPEGGLFVREESGVTPLPLVDLVVDVRVAGMLVHGTVTQRFVNPTGRVVEALYVFPLPDAAAVHAMEMRVGDRRIVAEVREREIARREYERALETGRKASLVEQQRGNLFRTSVANVNPGEEIEVRIEYLEEARYAGGEFALRVPLAFTPRFAPAGADAAEPEERAAGTAPRVSIGVSLEPGFELATVESESHAIRVARAGSAHRVELGSGNAPADRDFVLRWRVRASAAPRAAAVLERHGDARYGLLMLLPPVDDLGTEPGLATETIFVIDVSGSMAGPSIERAREALLAALDRLRPGDSFDIVRFHSEPTVFAGGLVPADAATLDSARAWVRGLEAGGGTMILPALVRALELAGGSRGARAQRIVFLTDGAVSNEQEVLRTVRERAGAVRLHVIGIGNAPNAALLRKLAALGRGLCDFVAEAGQEVNRVDAFFRRIDRPVIADLELEAEGVVLERVAPARLPDLHAGEPLYVSARLDGDARGTVRLRGWTDRGPIEVEVPLDERTATGTGVATRWARASVEALLDSVYDGVDAALVRDRVVEIALEHRIVTPYTSLIAVEERPTALDSAERVRVALPQGGIGRRSRAWLGVVLAFAAALLGIAARPRGVA